MNRVGAALRWRRSSTRDAPLCDQSVRVAEPRAFYSHFNRSESPHGAASHRYVNIIPVFHL